MKRMNIITSNLNMLTVELSKLDQMFENYHLLHRKTVTLPPCLQLRRTIDREPPLQRHGLRNGLGPRRGRPGRNIKSIKTAFRTAAAASQERPSLNCSKEVRSWGKLAHGLGQDHRRVHRRDLTRVRHDRGLQQRRRRPELRRRLERRELPQGRSRWAY